MGLESESENADLSWDCRRGSPEGEKKRLNFKACSKKLGSLEVGAGQQLPSTAEVKLTAVAS